MQLSIIYDIDVLSTLNYLQNLKSFRVKISFRDIRSSAQLRNIIKWHYIWHYLTDCLPFGSSTDTVASKDKPQNSWRHVPDANFRIRAKYIRTHIPFSWQTLVNYLTITSSLRSPLKYHYSTLSLLSQIGQSISHKRFITRNLLKVV